MLPWGHAAVGYLAYRLFRAARRRGPPSPVAAVAVGVGTQVPDLVDKPLAWNLGVLPGGRSAGHSLLVAAVVLAVAGRVRAVRDRPAAAGGFAVGYLSHPLADAAGPVLEGTPAVATFLLWPALPLRFDDEGYSILEVFLSLDPTLDVLVGLGLTVVAAAVWIRDGAPGTELLARVARPGRRERPDG
ncbi:MAG: metal-dependent hydrolase [Haloferacaceae archaeon]